VTKVIVDRTRQRKVRGVLKEQFITVPIRKNGAVIQRLKLRRIIFRSDDGSQYVFMTNNFTLPATQIATIYKNCVLIAQLLMVVIRKKASTKKSFSNMITVIRLHLMSYVELLYFIKDTYKAWRKANDVSIAFSP